jgi:hypothetical protein
MASTFVSSSRMFAHLLRMSMIGWKLRVSPIARPRPSRIATLRPAYDAKRQRHGKRHNAQHGKGRCETPRLEPADRPVDGEIGQNCESNIGQSRKNHLRAGNGKVRGIKPNRKEGAHCGGGVQKERLGEI